MYGLFGLIIGSFVNVVVLRSGVLSLSGKSGCMSCGAKIKWYDLIPVLSWLALRGRCRACGSRISVQYPAVELGTGVSFALIGGASLPPLATLLGLLICSVLIAIAVYDLRHTIIPDAWVWSFNALALISIFLPESSLTAFSSQTAFDTIAGPIVAAPLFVLWLVSRGKWIGLGDSKLALGIGWLLGSLAGIKAVLLAFILGAIIGLALIFFSSALWNRIVKQFIQHHSWHMSGAGITMKSEIPFGPFLIAACLFVWISQIYHIPIPFLWQ